MMPAALAQDAACPPMVVEADPSVTTRWPGLPNSVRDAFVTRDDVDRCARITLTLREGAIGVDVALPDGRAAHRSVSRREDVVPAIEALLLVPNAPPPEPSEASEASEPSESSPRPATPHTPPDATPTTTAPVLAREASAAAAVQPSSHLRIELSVATGARIGDGQVGVGVGALSFLDLSGWLVGFAGELDRYRTLNGPYSGGALELALLGGRRFRFGGMALDLAAGPAAALQGTTSFQSSKGGGGTPSSSRTVPQVVSASSSSTVPRLLIEARLTFGARSTVRTFVGIDGDFGPARSPDASLIPDSPRLPVWTVGLALGATVGTP